MEVFVGGQSAVVLLNMNLATKLFGLMSGNQSEFVPRHSMYDYFKIYMLPAQMY